MQSASKHHCGETKKKKEKKRRYDTQSKTTTTTTLQLTIVTTHSHISTRDHMMAQSRTLCLVLVAWVFAVVLLVGHSEGVKKREKGASRGRPRAGAGGAGGKEGIEIDIGGVQNLEQFAAAFEAGAWDSQIFGGGGVVGQGCAPDNPYQQPFKATAIPSHSPFFPLGLPLSILHPLCLC